MRRAWLIASGATAALTWFGFALGARRADEREARFAVELAQLRETSAQLELRLALLEQRGRSAERRELPSGALHPELVAQLARSQARQPSASPPREEAAPATSEQVHAQQLHYARYLDRVLDGERGEPDIPFARELRAKLDAALGEQSDLIDVHCTRSLCRARTSHASLAAFHVFQRRALMGEEKVWTGPVTFVVPEESDDVNEPLGAWVYLGRGEALPSEEAGR
jgi:hypothetical protein